MYAIILGAIVLLVLLSLRPETKTVQLSGGCIKEPDPANRSLASLASLPTDAVQGDTAESLSPTAGFPRSQTVCSPGSDIVVRANMEYVEPVQSCLSSLRMTRADEDQLNIVNHREHNNLSWVLRKPLQCARKRINCLQETTATPVEKLSGEPAPIRFGTWDSGCCDRGLMNIDPCNAPPGGLESGKDAPKFTGSQRAVLNHLSPDFMRTSLKEYYGGMYYYDFRYPREPINLEFAYDPEGFCQRNPTRYPCDVRASRHDLK